jgi:hypothetical protein
LIFVGLDPLLYGVHCRSCGASIPARHLDSQDAILAWNRRSGLASLGGKATKGLRSPRKLAAARRNLKIARKWKMIRQKVETARAVIKPYRQKELAEMEAAVAKDQAWLREREPAILADPQFRQIYEVLQRRKVSATNTEPGVP